MYSKNNSVGSHHAYHPSEFPDFKTALGDFKYYSQLLSFSVTKAILQSQMSSNITAYH